MIGVQSYGLSRDLKTAPEEVFRALADIGFDFLEPMILLEEKNGPALPCYFTRDHFHRLYGLSRVYPVRIGSVHVSPHVDGDMGGEVIPVRRFADHLSGLYQSFSITDFVVSSKISSVKSAGFWGNYLAEAAQLLSHTPCRLLYHNHDSEMHAVPRGNEQVPLLDYFIEASAGQILLELDVGWAGMVADEIAVTRRYAELIYLLHFKDFVPGCRGRVTCETSRPHHFAPSGMGDIRTAEILGMRASLPHFCGKSIVEQNASAGDIYEDLRIGCSTLRRLMK